MVTFFPQAVSSVAGLLSLSIRQDTPLVWVVKLEIAHVVNSGAFMLGILVEGQSG